jgi:phage terminase small subunit
MIIMKPTDKQQRFIDEYCIDQNATQAYRRAGYKVKSDPAANSAASRLYMNPAIRAAIDAKLAILARDTAMTAKEAWRESGFIARSSMGDIIDFSGINPKLRPANEIPESAIRALKSVKVKRYMEGTGEEAREVQLLEFRFWDKPGELHTRLKALGELKETIEHTGKDGGKIEAEVTIIDKRETIASFVEEFRAASRRNLQEAAELNGHTNGDGNQEAGAHGA